MAQAPDTPSICIGCGQDHVPGEGCGYDRAVQWTPYTAKERWEHVRLFPLGVGVAAATSAVIFVVDPPGTALAFYAGVVISTAIAFVVGGMGVRALVSELRRSRWRAVSEDGRDRALVAVVGGDVRYAFGESLRYDAVTWLKDAGALCSDAVLALEPSALRDALDDKWLTKLRAKAENDRLLTGDGSVDEAWALVAAACIFGLAARGEIEMSSGHYRGWGRGGGKMKGVTKGAEIAVVATGQKQAAGDVELRILQHCQPGPQSPTSVGDVMMALDEAELGSQSLDELRRERRASADQRDAALKAWQWLIDEDSELVARMIEHTLLVD